MLHRREQQEKKEAQDEGRDGIKMGKKKVKMKFCILGMTEVHILLFQFKFFYSLNISCAKSFLFRNYAFRNPDVTLQVCPRSNFLLKQKILHADMSSVTFPDA